jgi:hypothetical protein
MGTTATVKNIEANEKFFSKKQFLNPCLTLDEPKKKPASFHI